MSSSSYTTTTFNMGTVSEVPSGFTLFPLSGSPLQKWQLIQGVIYFSIGLSYMINPQLLDIFLIFFKDQKIFYPFDHELAQFIFTFVMIIGILNIVNGSDAFFNREIIKLALPSMENLPHSHNLINSLNGSFIRLLIIPLIMIAILISFGNNNCMITLISIMVCIFEPLFAIITLYIIRRYPPSDYPQYSAIILNINESDCDSESTKLIVTNNNNNSTNTRSHLHTFS